VETVRGLAAARFDWERALRDLSHAFPADAKLTTLNGDMGLPGAAAAAGGDTLRGSIQAPAISMTGCASSQTGVARMMARIKAVDGVTRVSLSKSDAGATSASGAGVTAAAIPACGKNPATFSVVAFFERSAALSQYSTSAAATLPVPNAVNQANGAGTTPADPAAGTTPTDGSTAQPQAAATPSATPSTVTTSTPSEGTP
jgi:hypothetical protein